MTRVLAAIGLASLLLAGCDPQPPTDRYKAWQDIHHAEVEAYATFLHSQGVADVVPMPELMRTGRRWQSCGVDEFAVPPRAAWPAILDTLRLVDELRAAGMLTQPVVASAFRTPSFNHCEGGSAKSRHLDNNALDFDLGSAADGRLCTWWRREGPMHHFGLGFYSPTRIHIDTMGYRTWGGDHTRKTSLCITAP